VGSSRSCAVPACFHDSCSSGCRVGVVNVGGGCKYCWPCARIARGCHHVVQISPTAGRRGVGPRRKCRALSVAVVKSCRLPVRRACRSCRVVQNFADGWTMRWAASSPMSGLFGEEKGRHRRNMASCETATWAHSFSGLV